MKNIDIKINTYTSGINNFVGSVRLFTKGFYVIGVTRVEKEKYTGGSINTGFGNEYEELLETIYDIEVEGVYGDSDGKEYYNLEEVIVGILNKY